MRLRPIWIVGLVFSVTTGAQAAPILDQSFEPTGINGFIIEASQFLAQSFRIGITGTLTSFELELARTFDPPAFGVDWELRRQQNRQSPEGVTIASGTIAPTDMPNPAYGFVPVDLTPFALSVHRGDSYAIVLTTLAPDGQGGLDPYAWRVGVDVNGDTYPRGYSWVIRPPQDEWSSPGAAVHGFKTFVEPGVPEPALGVLLVLASSAMALRRRMRRR